MARDHARIECGIWAEGSDFRTLGEGAQRLYFLLLSQEELSYSGLLPLRVRRWARMSPSSTPESIAAALAELDAARYVVTDHDTEEVLVRALIRRDGIWKQPNILAAGLRQAFSITSALLRQALAAELRRLPAEVCGPTPALVAEALVAGAQHAPEALAARPARRTTKATPPAEPKRRTTRSAPPAEPAPAPAETPLDAPETEGSPKGSGNPSAQSQGVGGRVIAVKPELVPTQVGVSRERASTAHRRLAEHLVAEHTPPQPQAVRAKLIGHAERLLGEGIVEAHVAAGLRRWSSKTLGAAMLGELVAEAMRSNKTAGQTMPAGADAKVAGWLELAGQLGGAHAPGWGALPQLGPAISAGGRG
ncbi:hypothetical protein NLX83_21465 [Allokutzneria sp. A3M-2-11 16]|uniref:hypothetical protein n=1 Tax=Allokutzneria sp. A3M-2-11 16 TaxID=2962043 RepID=UPI0020B76938|nr:hypothetical protein [Allokutzneria sp. A3M-2-11 16]MCP3801838.1 hypothetical protein [Allokutzneria sp. A3M-2-11 16]